MFSIIKKLKSEDGIILIFVLFFISVGIYFRFLDVGKWCFAVDEFYTATSVSKILDCGVPKFSNAGYYTRGLLFQYFEAFLSLIWGFNEGTLRYGPIFFNLLTFPALYLLGKRIGGKTLGLAAICIFSISLWEIEFSRFIRMYTAFQCVFLWYLFVLVKVIGDKDQNKIKWLYSLSICSIFIYAGSIFIVLLLFLPLCFNFLGNKRKHFIISSIILLFAYIYLSFDFRHLGVENYLPHGYQIITKHSNSFFPDHHLLKTVIETKWWLLCYVLIVLVNIYCIFRLWNNAKLTKNTKVIISIMMLLCLMHMFGACILFAILSFFINVINVKDIKNKIFIKITGVVGINFGFWFFYGYFTDLWWIKNYINIPEVNNLVILRKIFAELFKYPNIFDKIFYQWFGAIPILTTFLSLSTLFVVFITTFQKKRNDYALKVITVSLILCISAVGLIPTTYTTTRYTFFIYPLFIILFLYTIKYLVSIFGQIKYQHSFFLISSVLLFAIADDFSLNHIMNISSPEINFRMYYDRNKANHYYDRKDYKLLSEFVNTNAKKNDIIISTIPTCSYCLNRLDYIYIDYMDPKFKSQSTLNGTKEFWTSKALVHKYDNLLSLINNSQEDIWLIEYSDKYFWKSAVEKKISKQFSKYKIYTNIDGKIQVLKIPHKNIKSYTPGSIMIRKCLDSFSMN